jgi:hypothetical protein
MRHLSSQTRTCQTCSYHGPRHDAPACDLPKCCCNHPRDLYHLGHCGACADEATNCGGYTAADASGSYALGYQMAELMDARIAPLKS